MRTDKCDKASVGRDELPKRGPRIHWKRIWIRGGYKRIGFDSAARERIVEHVCSDVVPIRQEHRDHLVRVAIEPGLDRRQISLDAACIGKEARCMAHAQGAERVEVGLRLQEPNAGIQLLGHGDVLVVRGQHPDEGRIMRAHLGDVGVFPVAEFNVPVAGSVCSDQRKCKKRPQQENQREKRVHADGKK